MNESSKVGSRPASRVRIASAQGSRWQGRTGIVTRVIGRTVFVRFNINDPDIPFAFSETQEIK